MGTYLPNMGYGTIDLPVFTDGFVMRGDISPIMGFISPKHLA